MEFLQIKNLSKKYNNQIVLDKVNYSFPSNGLFVLVGESGSGKSTFINCICGIEKMDKGEIYLNDKKIKNFDKFRNRYIGMVYQNSNLISFLNVKDNICLLGQNENNININITKFSKTKINVLSGGEVQRVGILRALASSSKILLCDEPIGSLDKDNGMAVLKILKELSEKILVIIVTHNLELIKKYNPHIIKIENNKLIGNYVKKENKGLFRGKLKHLSFCKIIKISIKTLFKNPTKMLTSIFSLCLSFSFLLFTYSSSINVNKLIDENKTKYLDYTCLSIVKEKTKKIDNSSLTLVKEEMLSRNDILELNYLIKDLNKYHYDLSPLFTSYPLINYPINSSNYLSNIEWVPYFKSNETNFENKINGRFSKNEYEVVINNSASEFFSSSRFSLNLERNIDLKLANNEIISDIYFLKMDFTIVGVVEEFSLLETPKIYFPYDYYLKLCKEIKLENLSLYYKTPITLYDRLSTIRGEDDSFASNKLLIESKVEEIENIYSSINTISKENENYKVYSSPLTKIKTFEGIFDSIFVVLEIFLALTLIISVSLLALVLVSYILDYKKDIGIMLGCGVLKFDVTLIFVAQSLLLSNLSIFGSMIVYRIFCSVINSYLYDLCGINILSNTLTFNSGIFLLFIGIFISLILSIFISNKITNLNVSLILKED